MTFSRDQKHACALREAKKRKGVYPRWIADGKLKQHVADHEIACMEAIAQDYAPLDLFAVTDAPPPKATDEEREAYVALERLVRRLCKATGGAATRTALDKLARGMCAELDGALARIDAVRR